MGYETLGRKLGIGTRVAAKVLRERTRSATPAAPATPTSSRAEQRTPPTPVNPRIAARNVTRGVARGGRGFGRGFWKPFAHASRALWHEITGVFFALIAAFFGQGLWRARNDWRSGPEHTHFVVYLVICLLFVYFSVSAFASSRRSS